MKFFNFLVDSFYRQILKFKKTGILQQSKKQNQYRLDKTRQTNLIFLISLFNFIFIFYTNCLS